MSLLEIILIAIGLAMDCFAVSIASSICYGRYNWPKIVRMALFFGLFQGFFQVSSLLCSYDALKAAQEALPHPPIFQDGYTADTQEDR